MNQPAPLSLGLVTCIRLLVPGFRLIKYVKRKHFHYVLVALPPMSAGYDFEIEANIRRCLLAFDTGGSGTLPKPRAQLAFTFDQEIDPKGFSIRP